MAYLTDAAGRFGEYERDIARGKRTQRQNRKKNDPIARATKSCDEIRNGCARGREQKKWEQKYRDSVKSLNDSPLARSLFNRAGRQAKRRYESATTRIMRVLRAFVCANKSSQV